MCDNWAKWDTRVKVIHKENGGVSNARNLAIGLSSGEYLSFIDADDVVAEDFIQQMVMMLEQEEGRLCGYRNSAFFRGSYLKKVQIS